MKMRYDIIGMFEKRIKHFIVPRNCGKTTTILQMANIISEDLKVLVIGVKKDRAENRFDTASTLEGGADMMKGRYYDFVFIDNYWMNKDSEKSFFYNTINPKGYGYGNLILFSTPTYMVSATLWLIKSNKLILEEKESNYIGDMNTNDSVIDFNFINPNEVQIETTFSGMKISYDNEFWINKMSASEYNRDILGKFLI